jgi:hypothetical protein
MWGKPPGEGKPLKFLVYDAALGVLALRFVPT